MRVRALSPFVGIVVLLASAAACGGTGEPTPLATSPTATAPAATTAPMTSTPTESPASSPTRTVVPPETPTATGTPTPGVIDRLPPLDPDQSPLARALSFAPSAATGVGFTDWSLIKHYEGAGAINSKSELKDRLHFLLSTTRNQTAGSFFAQTKAQDHAEWWSWDTTDLEWEASYDLNGSAYVLKFPEGFDLDGVVGHLRERGFAEVPYAGITIYTHELQLGTDWATTTEFAILNTAVLPEYGMLVMAKTIEDVQAVLNARAGFEHLDSIAGLAGTLGAPAAATIVTPPASCPFALPGADVRPGRDYLAVGLAYRYDGDKLLGTIAIGYASEEDASADLDLRTDVATNGKSYRVKKPYSEVAFTVEGSRVSDSAIVIDVTPVGGRPSKLFQMVLGRDMAFAACAEPKPDATATP